MAYTNIDDPSAYFQALVYAGTGNSTSQPTTHTNDGNSDLQPDLIWFKDRGAAYSHYLVDSSRGRAKGLKSDTTAAETTSGSTAWDLVSFDSDGFKVGFPSEGNSTNGGTTSKVAWQWKANGGTTTSVSESQYNAGGTYQKNETAGFSIVSYTGIDTAGEVTHGLTTQPQVVIVKRRDSTGNWATYHESTGITGTLFLNTTAAKGDTTAYFHTGWGAATKFPIGTNADTNTDGATYEAYVFSERQGYSKFGKYVGNGNADGTFVYTGFRPAFVMVKKSSAAGGGWFMQDIKRGIKNSASGTALKADTTNTEAEIGATNYDIDFLSNGFKLRDSNLYVNQSGVTYIYMAFAEHPFVTSTGIPTTAR